MDKASGPVMVSCLLLTYNHAPFVRQAVESMLMQRTTFRYEIIAADDCSTDETRAILGEYAAAHSDKIRTFFHAENMGGSKLHSDAGLAEFHGKYMTVLEGDDYWVGEDRLQTLVDFLETHPGYACVAHKREVRSDDGTLIDYDPPKRLFNRDFTMEQFLRGERFSLTGALYVNFYPLVGDKYRSLELLTKNADDYQRCVMIQDFGKTYMLDRCFYSYRVIRREAGANYNSTMRDIEKYRDQLRILNAMQAFYAGRYDFSGELRRWQSKHLLLALLHGRRAQLKEIWRGVPRGRRLVTALYTPVYGVKRACGIGERSGWKIP